MFSTNQIIKSSYHLFASLFLFYLAFFIKNLSIIIKIILVFIALFHLYDTWWFFNNDGNAPI
jgi:hypothetical protein